MNNEHDTLDDLLYEVFKLLLSKKFNVETSRGNTSEVLGVTLTLNNPRARLSLSESRGKIFSCLGEFIWYCSGSSDLRFITHYVSAYRKESEDGRSVYGAYGPRIFGHNNYPNQLMNIITQLKEKPNTRRAVLSLLDIEDLRKTRKTIPCTSTLQFFIRDKGLHLHTHMRSNDAVIGIPHDIFCFTLFQEMVASELNLNLGKYYHTVGSLHMYDNHSVEKAKKFIEEGYQSTRVTMPAMPLDNPFKMMREIVKIEKRLRLGENLPFNSFNLPNYWLDLARLLHIHTLFKKNNFKKIKEHQGEINSEIYNDYINRKINQ